jgi:hypothetical protein
MIVLCSLASAASSGCFAPVPQAQVSICDATTIAGQRLLEWAESRKGSIFLFGIGQLLKPFPELSWIGDTLCWSIAIYQVWHYAWGDKSTRK